jgi:hypothetical protein
MKGGYNLHTVITDVESAYLWVPSQMQADWLRLVITALPQSEEHSSQC